MSQNSKKRLILIGAGSRGKCYTDRTLARSDYFELVAVAEPIEERREYIKKLHGIDDSLCFDTWEPLLAMPKMADVAIIATMDRDHVAPALAAIEKGYNLLLEKPAGATPEECRRIQRAAEERGVFVLVCHVLRYTKFFRALKDIIKSGEIGRVLSIQHSEPVGVVHQSHSFVRGNWRDSNETTPMIVQKTCHDMDILAWLVDKKCKRVSSFGTLTYFTEENAPKDAPERCTDGCPHSEGCPFYSKKLYLDDKDNYWFRSTCTKLAAPTDEDIIRSITTTDYGRCVYKCKNNVVDHQVVNLEFEDGILATFSMSAFDEGGRRIKIGGTKGVIEGMLTNPIIRVHHFLDKSDREIDLDAQCADNINGGHGGGDDGIVDALRDVLEGVPNFSVCDIAESCDNHLIAFAAEESRVTGKIIDLEEYSSRF
ncbi:MAG: Gfo/Idh/MocA family oxidoreductase [Clostridia bacterium]|nr:Gfo/Idh/MocA family oxidoreductase [Clostridia bacterium]